MKTPITTVALLTVLYSTTALAEKPEWAGSGQPPTQEQIEEHRDGMRQKAEDKQLKGRHKVDDEMERMKEEHKTANKDAKEWRKEQKEVLKEEQREQKKKHRDGYKDEYEDERQRHKAAMKDAHQKSDQRIEMREKSIEEKRKMREEMRNQIPEKGR